MAANNPNVTAADIITDVEARLGNPAYSASVYLPWISFAYQKVYQTITGVGQEAKETFFGDVATITLNQNTPNEYTITDYAPRFGGVIKLEVKYGATGDVYRPAGRMRSIAQWTNQDNVSTSYRGKNNVLYYILGPKIGFIPVPSETGAIAKLWYVKRPYQLTDATDVIDIPYRFTYPIADYVHAKTIQKANEDHFTGNVLEQTFEGQLEQLALAVANEFNENDGTYIEDAAGGILFGDPLRY